MIAVDLPEGTPVAVEVIPTEYVIDHNGPRSRVFSSFPTAESHVLAVTERSSFRARITS